MRVFAEKQRQPQQRAFDITRSTPAVTASHDRIHPLLHLQRLVGNQVVQRLLGGEPADERLATAAVAPSVQDVAASPGQPLNPTTRASLEGLFGHDFSRVRVHSDATAARSAQDLHAYAYTMGHNIVFGAGQFAPETSEGGRLLAHELAHVVQQSALGSRAASTRIARAPKPGEDKPLIHPLATCQRI